ncbi:hypothetical protein G6F63_013786 [Rhizopus arrhizus]|nr:hypothetical protein G6F63_013786 [Rhizopus arrhizus]
MAMIKQPHEIALMAESGRLLAQVFAALDRLPLQGRRTMEINDFVERMIVDELHARPASKGQYGFPYVLNTSIDNVICHGVPSPTDVLRNGQIVKLDITMEKNGFIADSSTTYLVGEVDYAARRLVQTTYQAMWKGIATVRPGARLGDSGHAIARHARSHGYSVVKEYCGHGIGKVYHDEPQVVHYGRPGQGLVLQPGMTFTIEPMINEGTRYNKVLPDGWTVVTKDRKLSAQWEHMVVVTETGYEVLTPWPDGYGDYPPIP